MTLLINGCSFAECWTPSSEFVKQLDCKDYINLGKRGTSFQRTVRSTVEWIAQNGNPSYVIIPITFSHRWELALNDNEDPIDGSWVPLQNSNYISEKYNLQSTNLDQLKKLVDDYYSIIPTIKTYWDKMFTEIIMFAGWLDNKKISYLMFDMCNQFDKKHLKGYKGFEKIEFIEQNKNIIDLFSFCGNLFMWNSLPDIDKKQIDPICYHHQDPQYKVLEDHLLKYISSCKK
jgi:hypothetical protein